MMKYREIPPGKPLEGLRAKFDRAEIFGMDLPNELTYLSLPIVRGNSLELRFMNLTLSHDHPLCPPDYNSITIGRGSLIFPNLRKFVLTIPDGDIMLRAGEAPEGEQKPPLHALRYTHPCEYPSPLGLMHDLGNRGTIFHRGKRYTSEIFEIVSDRPYAVYKPIYLGMNLNIRD